MSALVTTLTCARVCLTRGRVLSLRGGGEPTPSLTALAALAPTLLAPPAVPGAPGIDGRSGWSSLFARAGSAETRDGFRELVLVSEREVRLLRARSDGTASIAIAAHDGSLGFVLSAARAELAALEAEA